MGKKGVIPAVRIGRPIQALLVPSRLLPGVELQLGVFVDDSQPIAKSRDMPDQLAGIVRLPWLPPQARRSLLLDTVPV